jgi:hypothetical protein
MFEEQVLFILSLLFLLVFKNVLTFSSDHYINVEENINYEEEYVCSFCIGVFIHAYVFKGRKKADAEKD